MVRYARISTESAAAATSAERAVPGSTVLICVFCLAQILWRAM
jgi:hypothetical protein